MASKFQCIKILYCLGMYVRWLRAKSRLNVVFYLVRYLVNPEARTRLHVFLWLPSSLGSFLISRSRNSAREYGIIRSYYVNSHCREVCNNRILIMSAHIHDDEYMWKSTRSLSLWRKLGIKQDPCFSVETLPLCAVVHIYGSTQICN